MCTAPYSAVYLAEAEAHTSRWPGSNSCHYLAPTLYQLLLLYLVSSPQQACRACYCPVAWMRSVGLRREGRLAQSHAGDRRGQGWEVITPGLRPGPLRAAVPGAASWGKQRVVLFRQTCRPRPLPHPVGAGERRAAAAWLVLWGHFPQRVLTTTL